MLALVQDLVGHKGYANASLLRAIERHEPATRDPELLKLLHHTVLSNRFWLHLILARPFSLEAESALPESLAAIAAVFRKTYALERELFGQLRESELVRPVETPYIPGRSFTIAQALVQVCLHTHGHRAQCAARLRHLGGAPSNMDFIVWLKDRPPADWG